MARPRRSEQTRAALIEEGIAQLSAQGYHGTGIKQILDAVQVPKGSFYNYFESKEAYVAEILDHYGAKILEGLDRQIADSTAGPLVTLREILECQLAKYESQSCAQGCLVGILAAEIGSTSSLCQMAMQHTAGGWEKRMAGLLQAAQDAGQVRQDLTADQLAKLIWSSWEGALMRMRMDGNADHAKEIIELMFGSILMER
ncbi:TetR family transcriptional regulator C-terminal domain-containing protein [Aestuariispira insulae]|uniref:TetR family transcriptional regulator n=1 Tax=Aestuariispira insulae TaxID=1461337 RepID=A0A3D9HLE5_9PROT|nr:TetR family transcriptional regulator C-terminal domain-containing protein [Aestuariispira insulae]RED49716.1 TetR family transcriptional regulator [Aestuariispira insulae]